jgi:hypothetical protein
MRIRKVNTPWQEAYRILFLSIILPLLILFFLILAAVPAFVIILPLMVIGVIPIRMSKHHMPIVQTYLNHFEQLYPELVQYMNGARNGPLLIHSEQSKTIYWPHSSRTEIDWCIPFVVLGTTKYYEFSAAAALFAELQTSGFPIPAIWRFLKTKVEEHVALTDEEKARFASVMKRYTRNWNIKGSQDVKGPGKHDMHKYVVPHERVAGMRPVVFDPDNLDWLLERGALLVPDSDQRWLLAKTLTKGNETHAKRLSPGGSWMWGRMNEKSSPETAWSNYWQVVDLRSVNASTDIAL